MSISNLNYTNPASGSATNWVTEGSGVTQLSILSDGTGTGTPLGTTTNPLSVSGTFYQETQNVAIVDSSGVSFGTVSNPLIVDQSSVIDQLAASNARYDALLNDAFARPFFDVTGQVFRPVLGAIAVSNFPANARANGICNGLNSQVAISTANAESVGINITGTFTGTITFEASVDGLTWAACFAMPIAGTAPVSSATAAGTWIVSLGGMLFFRARCSAFTSGQPTVALTASVATSLNQVYSPAATALLCTASQGGTWTVQPGNTANTTAWLTSSRGTASVTGAYTKHRLMSAATTNATSVKASAGMLYEAVLCNSNAAIRWVKFYNSASAPTPGSGTPSESIMIPANSTIVLQWKNGNPFSTGLAYCTVTGAADSDSTAVALNDLSINLYYL